MLRRKYMKNFIKSSVRKLSDAYYQYALKKAEISKIEKKKGVWQSIQLNSD